MKITAWVLLVVGIVSIGFILHGFKELLLVAVGSISISSLIMLDIQVKKSKSR